jgi:general secretion pathway protein I
VKRVSGFTLIEVLVALVIVAFGMGAVLSALSSSANNISALRERSLAEWVALNQVADTRLLLNPPQPGVTEGDVKDFGNADWHWRQDVIAVDMIPGMLEIAVRVTRIKPGQTFASSGSTSSSKPKTSSGLSSGVPSSFLNSSSGGYSSGSYSSGGFSSGGFSSGSFASGGYSSMMKNLGASKLPTSNNQQWTATVIGFRGDAVAPPNGEQPDWSCINSTGTNLCMPSNGPGASSSGATANPNPGANPGSSGISIGPGQIGSSGGATQ